MVEHHLVSFTVHARPATFATAHEAAWKEAVRAAVGASGVEPLDARFAVSIDFRTPVPRRSGEVWDLDDLVKPTLDAMEGIFGLRAWKGVPQPDDDRVDRLAASKRTAESEADVGASITVWTVEEPVLDGSVTLLAAGDEAHLGTGETWRAAPDRSDQTEASMAPRGAALYLFPSDVLDEGVEAVRRRGDELGVDTLTIAVAYHQARDLVPHAGRKPRVRYRQDGVFFEPDENRWAGSPVRPRVQPHDERQSLDALVASGARVEGWTVFLHNTGLGEEHPELTSETCFGDRLLSNICPLNPAAGDYAAALADDVSARGLDVVAEALSGHTFAHGHHHERSFTPLSPCDEAVLGICFCEHCRSAGRGVGLDVERLAASARDRVQAAFAGAAGGPATPDALAETVGGEVLDYLQARRRGVDALAARIARVVRSNGRRTSFMDLTGAVLGYGDGQPAGPPAATQGWQLSIDPSTIAPQVDSYSVLGYASDPARLRDDVASYRAAIGETRLRVVLRPGFPDTVSGEHLRDKVLAAHDGGADQVDFYSYGMYDQTVLDRIPFALGRPPSS